MEEQTMAFKIKGEVIRLEPEHIEYIEGLWGNKEIKPYSLKEIEGSVKWSKIDEEMAKKTSELHELSYEEAQKYIPAGDYLKQEYAYYYEVPVFPQAGNAIIRVYADNSQQKLMACYAFPAENEYSGNVYQNKNVISAAESTPKAILISNETRDNYVGTVKQEGNWAIVDSKESGYTRLKADVDLSEYGIDELSEIEGGVMYTSVQWGPVPTDAAVMPSEDFYTLTGQTVEITAHLYDNDNNHNAVTTAGKNVKFYTQNVDVDGEDAEITYHSEAETSKVEGTNVVVEEITNNGKTDGDGVVKLKLKLPQNADEVLNLYAKSAGYTVRLEVGSQNKEVDKADIHWVIPGLSFTDMVADNKSDAEPTKTEAFGEEKDAPSLTSRTVGENWIFGYQIAGRLPEYDTNPLYVDEVSGLTVNIAKMAGVGTVVTEGQKNGVAKVVSDENGSTTLRGSLDNKKVSDVKFVIRAKADNSLIGIYNNVGTGEPNINATLNVRIAWNVGNKIVEFVYPQGNILSAGADTKIYLYAHDEKGNAYKGVEVTYKLSADEESGIANITETKTTDSNGLIEIPVNAPNKKATINVSATTAGCEIQSGLINYNLTTDKTKFAIVNAEIVAGSGLEPDKVRVAFTNVVNPAQVNAEAFVVKDEIADKSYKVNSAALVNDENGNMTIVELTMDGNDLHTAANAITVAAKPYELAASVDTLLKNVEYSLMDQYGNLLDNAYSSVLTAPQKQYSISAVYENGVIKVTVKKNNEAVNSLDGGKIYAVSSNPNVLGSGTGVYTVTATPFDVPIDNVQSETIYLYYMGAGTKVNLDGSAESTVSEDDVVEDSNSVSDNTTADNETGKTEITITD